MPVSSNINMKSMFKSACEPCSKSKIKCDGSHPCANCVRREQQCIFTFKKKRGPKRTGERDDDEETERVKRPRQSAMSSYERRVWSVFFTIFKNQKKNAAENPFCWDWFIQQLQRLGNYVHSANSAKGDKLREMLTTFYETLNMSHNEIHNHVTVPCPIPPHLCSICTSTVFDRIIALDEDSHEPSLRLALPVKNRSQFAFDNNWKVTSFQEKFDSNSNACMVFESSLDQFGVFVNPKFTQVFGYTGPLLTDLVTWSGGGFLPWGSDLLAALLTYESDVLLYLQIMNIKYQAHSLPRGIEAYKRFPAVFRGFYKPKGADEEGYQHVEVVKDLYEKHFSKSPSERLGSVTKTFQSKFQDKKISNSDTKVEHWMDCILDPKTEWVIPSLNVFKCWVNAESLDSDTDFSLEQVKEKLRPKTVEFSCTVRVKQKNNCIHQRLEFLLLNEEIDEEPPTLIMGPIPQRVTNEEPLVPLLPHGDHVQRHPNEEIWAYNSTNNLTHTESSDAEDGENSRENEDSTFEDRLDYTKVFEDDTTGLAGFFTELDLPPPSLNRSFVPQYYPASNVLPVQSYGERREYRIPQGVASEYQFGQSTMEQGVQLEEDLDITWLDDIGNWARD